MGGGAFWPGQNPVVSTRTERSIPFRFFTFWRWERNSSLTVLESVMSLNIPSSLLVNWQPHSDFNFEIIIFSESSEADF